MTYMFILKCALKLVPKNILFIFCMDSSVLGLMMARKMCQNSSPQKYNCVVDDGNLLNTFLKYINKHIFTSIWHTISLSYSPQLTELR